MKFELDDQFLRHHKTKRAIRKGAAALQMWLALRTYVAINNSNGVIPDEDIDDLDGAPENPREWLKVLVGCGKPLPEGGRGAGLVDPIEGGWTLHDYGDYGLSPEEVEQRRELSRERQKRWRRGRVGLREEPTEQTRNAVSNASRNASRNGVTNALRNANVDATGDGDGDENTLGVRPGRAYEKSTEGPLSEDVFTKQAIHSVSSNSNAVSNASRNASRNALGDVPDPIRSDPKRSDLTVGVGSKDLTGYAREDTSLPPPPPSTAQVREEIGRPNAPPEPRRAQPLETSDVHREPQDPKRAPEGNLARLPTRRERATDDLMSCPIGELGKRCRLNPYDAGMSPVGDRAELRRVNEAWSRAVGLSPHPLGTYSDGNRPLKTLLDAFEIATEAELLRACEQAARDDWCCGRKGSERDTPRKRDIGCLSQTVLRRLLDACEESRPKFVPARVQAILDEEARKRAGV